MGYTWDESNTVVLVIEFFVAWWYGVCGWCEDEVRGVTQLVAGCVWGWRWNENNPWHLSLSRWFTRKRA